MYWSLEERKVRFIAGAVILRLNRFEIIRPLTGKNHLHLYFSGLSLPVIFSPSPQEDSWGGYLEEVVFAPRSSSVPSPEGGKGREHHHESIVGIFRKRVVVWECGEIECEQM
jgi:hypothetical protein